MPVDELEMAGGGRRNFGNRQPGPERCRVGNSSFLPFTTCPYFLLLCAAGEGSLLRRRRAPRRIGAKMLDIALGFFIALIVIISFTGLVFLYPLTFRVSVSQGHMALPTAPEDGGEPAA